MFARKRLVLHELKSRERDRPIKRSPDGGGEKLERFDRVGMESPAEEKSRPFARSQTAARSYCSPSPTPAFAVSGHKRTRARSAKMGGRGRLSPWSSIESRRVIGGNLSVVGGVWGCRIRACSPSALSQRQHEKRLADISQAPTAGDLSPDQIVPH